MCIRDRAKQAGGKPAIDPSVISSMVLGLVMQVAVDRIYGRLKMDLSELSATLADACWRVIEGGAAPVKQ